MTGLILFGNKVESRQREKAAHFMERITLCVCQFALLIVCSVLFIICFLLLLSRPSLRVDRPIISSEGGRYMAQLALIIIVQLCKQQLPPLALVMRSLIRLSEIQVTLPVVVAIFCSSSASIFSKRRTEI